MLVIATHKIHKNQGGGKVQLVDVKDGDWPFVVNAADLEGARWLLVVFPERVGLRAATRAGGLKMVKGGEWLVTMRKGKPIAKKKAKSSSARAPAHTTVSKPENKPPEAPKTKEPEAKTSDEEVTPEKVVYEDLNQAMDAEFPLERLMTELNGLLTASEPIYSKEGDYAGDRPAFQVRMAALKTCLEYREGRAREREKPQPKAKSLTLAELEAMLSESEESCAALESLIRKCRAKRQKK